jgi:hypothetical protein
MLALSLVLAALIGLSLVLCGQLQYLQFEWALPIAFLAAAATGMLGGLILAHRISSGSWRRAFASGIVALGTFLAVENLLP